MIVVYDTAIMSATSSFSVVYENECSVFVLHQLALYLLR